MATKYEWSEEERRTLIREMNKVVADSFRSPFGFGAPRIRIRCAVCDKLVDRVQQDRVYDKDVYRFRVWCHGDTDTCEIDGRTVESHPEILRSEGVAFTKKRIEHEREQHRGDDTEGSSGYTGGNSEQSA